MYLAGHGERLRGGKVTPSGTGGRPGLGNTQSAEDLRGAILTVLASDDGDVSKVLEDISAPLVSHQGGYDDPEDTLDLLSVIADEGTEDDDMQLSKEERSLRRNSSSRPSGQALITSSVVRPPKRAAATP